MPTYEYRCADCGHEFEEFQSISDAPVTICPSCGGKTQRIISGGAGLIFKGSGFYITDYRNSKYKADATKDSSSGVTGASGAKPSSSSPATSSKPSAGNSK